MVATVESTGAECDVRSKAVIRRDKSMVSVIGMAEGWCVSLRAVTTVPTLSRVWNTASHTEVARAVSWKGAIRVLIVDMAGTASRIISRFVERCGARNML